MEKEKAAFERILKIMDDLREKCPWDQKQTIATLRPLTIEETYELADAITQNDWKGIKEELGDLLLHLVFYSKIAKEQNQFTVDEMINSVCEKLIHRHPHIYSDTKVADEEEVKQNWEKLKMKEGRTSVMGGVPNGLPAIIKAWRIQDKAKQVGFEWDDIADVWKKVEEEKNELQEAVQTADLDKIEDEMGDFLFAIINYARFLKIDPEMALERSNQKFLKRFRYIEEKAKTLQKDLTEMTLAEMDSYWNEAKKL